MTDLTPEQIDEYADDWIAERHWQSRLDYALRTAADYRCKVPGILHAHAKMLRMDAEIATLERQLAEREQTEQDLWEKLNCQDAEIDELKRQLAEAQEGKKIEPCFGCGCDVCVPPTFEERYCCSGRECGCEGKPLNPVFCNKCDPWSDTEFTAQQENPND